MPGGFFLKKRSNMNQLSWAITLRAVEGLCIFRGCDPVTGAGKRHASVRFYMLRWYKCAEFCILKGQNCVAWFGHGCSGTRTHWNTNGILVWAWMLWYSHSLEHEQNYGLGMDALVIALTGTRTELWFGHGCSGEPMLVNRGFIRVLEFFAFILGET